VTRALTSATSKSGAAAFVPFFSPIRDGVLQRKCDCGQHTGGGECASCKKKKASIPEVKSTKELRETTVAAGRDSNQPSFAEMPLTSRQATGRTTESDGSEQEAGEEKVERKYSDKGVLLTLAGSGTCNNGGAESGCDPETGAYKIYANNNTCCTKDCSRLHEQTHVSDITNWGCCKALSVAYNKPGADKAAAVQKYNDWLSRAIHLTECHAYSNGADCAKQMARQKDCSGAGRDTDCCKDAEDYRARYSARAKTECDAAPKDPPACPVF
jgi:hypothetical protein